MIVIKLKDGTTVEISSKEFESKYRAVMADIVKKRLCGNCKSAHKHYAIARDTECRQLDKCIHNFITTRCKITYS